MSPVSTTSPRRAADAITTASTALGAAGARAEGEPGYFGERAIEWLDIEAIEEPSDGAALPAPPLDNNRRRHGDSRAAILRALNQRRGAPVSSLDRNERARVEREPNQRRRRVVFGRLAVAVVSSRSAVESSEADNTAPRVTYDTTSAQALPCAASRSSVARFSRAASVSTAETLVFARLALRAAQAYSSLPMATVTFRT